MLDIVQTGFHVFGYEGGLMFAFVGVCLLILIYNSKKGRTTLPKNKPHENNPDDSVITRGMLDLLAVLLKAHPSGLDTKLNTGQAMLSRTFGAQKAEELIKNLSRLMEENIDVHAVCRKLRLHTSYFMRENLTHLLFRLSYSGGEISTKELDLLQLIANHLAITTRDYNKIKMLFIRAQPTDFDILGINPTADKRKIKAAYRQMSKKFHPDGLGDINEHVKTESAARFRKVKEAYERVIKN